MAKQTAIANLLILAAAAPVQAAEPGCPNCVPLTCVVAAGELTVSGAELGFAPASARFSVETEFEVLEWSLDESQLAPPGAWSIVIDWNDPDVDPKGGILDLDGDPWGQCPTS